MALGSALKAFMMAAAAAAALFGAAPSASAAPAYPDDYKALIAFMAGRE